MGSVSFFLPAMLSLGLVVAAAAYASGDLLSVLPGGGSEDVAVLFSANRHLILSDCGCSLHPHGAFEREERLAAELRPASRLLLYLAAGTAWTPEESKASIAPDLSPVAARHELIERWSRAGLSAFHPSPKDLSLGRRIVRELRARAAFPFVVTNVSDGAPELVETVRLTWGNRRILVLGLLPEKSGTPDYVVENPAQAITRHLAPPNTLPDLLVILSSLGEDEEKAVVAGLPVPTIVLGAGGGSFGAMRFAPGVVGARPAGDGNELVVGDFTLPPAARRLFDSAAAARSTDLWARRDAAVIRLRIELRATTEKGRKASISRQLRQAEMALAKLPPIPTPAPGEGLYRWSFVTP